MARITITLTQSEREALRLAAERDLRDTRGQARYLIIKGLAAYMDADVHSQQLDAKPCAKVEGACQ